MDLSFVQPLFARSGPWASVYLDVTLLAERPRSPGAPEPVDDPYRFDRHSPPPPPARPAESL